MALILVFDFEDEEEALNFGEQHEAHLFAIHKRPTQFCEGGHSKKIRPGFTKGKKFGWWVCNQCYKPKRLYWKNVMLKEKTALFGGPYGYNLLRDFFDEDPVVSDASEPR